MFQTNKKQYDHICLDMIPEENRTEELCMRAVTDYVYNLIYVPDYLKTEKLLKQAFSGKKVICSLNDGCVTYPGLYYLEDQYKSPIICELAVIQDGSNLRFVPKHLRTSEMCRTAVLSDASMIHQVPPELQTYELCKLAVEGMKMASVFVDIPDRFKTVELCLLAIERDSSLGLTFDSIPPKLKTLEVCTEAVKRFKNAIENIPPFFNSSEMYSLYRLAVTTHATALFYLPKKYHSAELCELAVKLFPEAYRYVASHRKTKRLSLYALEMNMSNFPRVPVKYLTYELCHRAVVYDCNLYQFVPVYFQTEELYAIAKSNGFVMRADELNSLEICMKAVKNNGMAIQQVREEFKTYELCWTAVSDKLPAINYVPKELIDHSLSEMVVKKGGMTYLKYLPDQYKTKDLCIRAIHIYTDDPIDSGRPLRYVPHQVRDIELHLIYLMKHPGYYCYMPQWIKFLIKARLIQSNLIKRNNEIKSKPMRRLPVYQVFGNKELQDYIFAYV